MRRNSEKRVNILFVIGVFMLVSAVALFKLPLFMMTTVAAELEKAEIVEEELIQTCAPADLTISSARELNEFAQKVNNGNTYEGKVVKLTNDIVFDGVTVNNFTPIGFGYDKCFRGTFDGCGYTISGIDVTNHEKAALFGYIRDGVVKNVTLENCSFVGTNKAGGIAAGMDTATFLNCHVINSKVTNLGEWSVGAVVGEGSGTIIIKNCSSNSKIDGGENAGAGGIVGVFLCGAVENCYNTGNVTGSKTTLEGIGGICGYTEGTIQNCYNTGTVSGDGYIGGIVGSGKEHSIIANCYTSEAACTTNFGSMEGTERNCKAYATSYMQSAAFLKQLNANRGGNADWFVWEKRAESVYPVLVKMTNINVCNVSPIADCVYNKKEQTPEITLTRGNTTLIKDVDYDVTYQDNINPGTATVTISGLGMYTGDIVKTFVIHKVTSTISCKTAITKTYGAKSFSLNAKLVSGVSELSYQSDNTKVARVDNKGKVTVCGVGVANIIITCPETKNYSGATVVTTITVKPKKQSISVTRNGSKMKISWKKDSKVSGYEVQYATNKSFKKNCKTITIKKKNKSSYTVKKLKGGKKYYVRVRSYKNATSNGQKVTVTSAWSKVKKVSGY